MIGPTPADVEKAVEISAANFPKTTMAVLSGLEAASETVDAVVSYTDDVTGNVVSTQWNSLDPKLRSQLKGSGKVLSIAIPAAKVKAVAELAGAAKVGKVTKTGATVASDTHGGAKLLWGSWIDYPKVVVDGREYAKVGERLYSRHAVDRMQPSGLGAPAGAVGPGRNVTATMVEQVIKGGEMQKTMVNGVERASYTLGNVRVWTENDGKTVVTILRIGSQ